MRRIAATGLALGATLAAAAPAVGASSFTQKVNQACAAAGTKIDHLSGKASLSELGQQQAILAALVGQLKAITPPAAQAKDYMAYVSLLGAAAADFKDELVAIQEGNTKAAARDLKKLVVISKRAAPYVHTLDVPACDKSYMPRGR